MRNKATEEHIKNTFSNIRKTTKDQLNSDPHVCPQDFFGQSDIKFYH